MTHSLALGGLTLTGDKSFADPTHGFWFEVAAEGTEFGQPEAVARIITSLLTDGAIVSYDRDDNRTIPVRVRVNGPTLAAVAHGEAALRQESKRRNELTWQPPDTFAPPSVFETFPSSMSRQSDGDWDLDELVRRSRTFGLSLTCSPFARSLEPTTVEALVAGSTTIVVDTCDSATNWTGFRNGFPYAASAAWEAGSVGVAELEDAITSPETWTLTRASAVDFTSTPYLKIEVRTIASDVGQPMNVAAYAGSVTPANLLPVMSVRRLAGGAYFEVVYDATGRGSVSALTFNHVSPPGHPWQGLFIRSLARTDVTPGTTSRQQTRVIEVGGTERTPASIHVQSVGAELPLTQAIVHTCPGDGSGYSPPLRRWRISGGSTPIASAPAFSGFYESIVGTGITCDTPTSALPEGGYVLAAYMRSTAATTVSVAWSTSTIFPGGTREEGFTVGSELVTFPDDGWHIVPLATLSLPSVRTKAGKVRTIIQVPSSSTTIFLDDAWLFRTDKDCALTVLTSPHPHLWINSAGVDAPVPTAWVGDGVDVRVHPGTGLQAMGTHILSPEGTAIFTATLVPPMTDATFYRRWHSNAAE